jgi:hypothetical protein
MTNGTSQYMKEWRLKNAKRCQEYEKNRRRDRREYNKRWYLKKKEKEFKAILKRAA